MQRRSFVNGPEFKEGHARSGTLPREAFRGPSRLESFWVITDSAAIKKEQP
jgi:hypothetical protein